MNFDHAHACARPPSATATASFNGTPYLPAECHIPGTKQNNARRGDARHAWSAKLSTGEWRALVPPAVAAHGYPLATEAHSCALPLAHDFWRKWDPSKGDRGKWLRARKIVLARHRAAEVRGVMAAQIPTASASILALRSEQTAAMTGGALRSAEHGMLRKLAFGK